MGADEDSDFAYETGIFLGFLAAMEIILYAKSSQTQSLHVLSNMKLKSLLSEHNQYLPLFSCKQATVLILAKIDKDGHLGRKERQ